MSWQHISKPTNAVMERVIAGVPVSEHWFRYVPLDQVGEYLVKGWEISDDMANCHHGNYACLMMWKGEGEPK